MTTEGKSVGGIPAVGFGTWNRRGAEGVEAVRYALEVGYRHIDTAQSYENEEACGEAIATSGLAREDVFVTTKVAQANLVGGKFRASVEESLEKLKLDQVDLLLIHWPVAQHATLSMPVYLEELADVHDAGLTRLIGLSNFTIPLLDQALALLGDRKVSANQVEIHPWCQNRRLAARCRELGIPTTAYSPIGQGKLGDDPVLTEIAAARGADWSQVALAFLLAEGHVVIPTSGKRERIAANFAAQEIELSADEIDRIRGIDRNAHFIDNRAWMPAWD